jgi:hypothetical protein
VSYRRALQDAVGKIPPTSIDVDQIIGRQRRLIRLRRVGVLVAAAVAVGAITIGAVAATGRPDAQLPVAPTPSVPAVPTPPPPQQQGKAFTRLDTAIFEAIDRVAPGLRWISWNSGITTRGYEPNGWMGQGEVRSDAGTGELVVQFSPPDWGEVGPCTGDLVKNGCVMTTGPGGEKIMTFSTRNPANGKHRPLTLTHSMFMQRPDGRVLIVDIHGADEKSPLTIAQLTALVLDPAVAKVAEDPFRYDNDASRIRIDSKVFAALNREAPGIQAYGGGGVGNGFFDDRRGKNTEDDYWTQGRITLAKVTGRLTVEMHRRDPGTAGALTGTGPHGERYRTGVTGSGASAIRMVHVLRTDGTWLAVGLSADKNGAFALTGAQQEAVALDPAIALSPK